MTILYHAPLSCSLATRIAAAEAEVELDIHYLNLATKELEQGGSLLDINPLGQVSTMRLDDGSLLTETASCIAWVQSQSRKAEFHISADQPEYFQMLRWLNFCATELHKQIFRVVFYPEATDPVKERIRQLAPQRFKLLDQHLSQQSFLLGEQFSAADAYLSWFFVLADHAQLDHSDYPALNRYREQVLARPAIAELVRSDWKKDAELNQQIIPAIPSSS